MNDIMVCVKQVPNTTNIKLDPVRHTLIREGVPSVLNPFDEVALDAAISCKARFGARVGVLSMGPPQAEEMLQGCLDWGADEAFLLTDRRLAGSDTLATARALHAAIVAAGYTTVFCGQETADSSTGHLGPSLAEMFHVPQATSVTKVIALSGSSIEVEVELERSAQVLRMKLPAVVSFAKAGRAGARPVSRRSGKVRRLTLDDIGLSEDRVGLEGSPTTVVDIDIDINSLNYLVVDDRLDAFDRIATVLRGGITENERRVIFRSMTEEAYQALLALLR
jgi:electron transfer flavoprotein beta subunit